MAKIKTFSLHHYVEEAMHKAEYYKDENGVVVVKVPGAQGFFAEGDSFDEARDNLREVIEGNILLALQVGLEIPRLEGVAIEEKDVQISSSQT